MIALLTTPVLWAQVPMTPQDFHAPGTQVGDMPSSALREASECRTCHGDYDAAVEPYATWAGSLMALGGRDPLFFAQMSNANQDVANVGSFCLRCHVPASVVSGNVNDPSGASLSQRDREGVGCHFCHSLVDPDYKPGISPPEDEPILAGLSEVPNYAANAMFVLDPQGRRRGPYDDTNAPHEALPSPYHRESALCGTCHDVGNVAVSRLEDGRYRYNLLDAEAPDHDPWTQFPLERTYTEWKLSSFAAGGVDMGGRFGGNRGPIVSTCQDCHMPTVVGKGCVFGGTRNDLALHDFAGAAVPSLDLIAAYTANDPSVDQNAVAAGRLKALAMLQRAASVDLRRDGDELVARVTNESGHKLPTGHIEGRRVWLNLRFLDAAGGLLAEVGHYDAVEAHLDEVNTVVYEMHVALSEDAAAATGLTPGPTTRMALADTIWKDTRIPPRGFDIAAFEAGGAPVVGIDYANGQYWHEQRHPLPPATERIHATLYYQSTPRHYIEALRNGNHTDLWGETLHSLWEQTGRGAPLAMVSEVLILGDMVFRNGFEAPGSP
jgi:hypothetical protein